MASPTLSAAAPTLTREELAAWLHLTQSPGLGDRSVRRLLAAFGLPTQVLAQSTLALQQVVTAPQAQALKTAPADLDALVDTTWAWLTAAPQADGVARRLFTLADADYPAALLAIEDPPPLLYAMGHVAALPQVAEHAIAMVGSRNPTPQGAQNARQFAKNLAASGLTIVSGLALGVDGAAHEGALDGAAAAQVATVAVVGTGLDRVYPKPHHALAQRIAQHGILVSEYPLGTPPLPGNFPKRNRLIAGLSQGTLVVEAALQSGSLITARLANEQGKEVFAIPGSIHATQSKGCHALIRQGAKLVESAQDVWDELHIAQRPLVGLTDDTPRAKTAIKNIANDAAPTSASVSASTETEADSTAPESDLLRALGHDPTSLDALQARTGWPTPELQAQLLTLELDGQVARLPGALFQRLNRA